MQKFILIFFYQNKPKHVKILNNTKFQECACVYCTNVRNKLIALGIPGINDEMDLYKILLCDKTSKYRNKDCIFRDCNVCKDWIKKIESLASDLNMEKMVHWSRWGYMNYTQKSGKDVPKRVSLPNYGTKRKCLDELIQLDIMGPGRNKTFTFVIHFFTQSFQFQMYKQCEDTLKPGQCINVQDFAQNIEIRYLIEIKARNWAKRQISMHVQVLTYKTSKSKENQDLFIVHLSDILKHDAPMVHYATQDSMDILSERHPDEKWEKFYLWSDGCTSQYKGKSSFFFLDQFDTRVERNFFGSEHGKNRCDSFTGQIKIAYKRAVKSGRTDINNASDLKTFLCENYKNDSTKIFKLIETDDNNLEAIQQKFHSVKIDVLSDNCTRTLHQIKPTGDTDTGHFLTRNFSCFCSHCLKKNWKDCDNKDLTGGKFKKRILKSHDGTFTYPHNESENEDDIIEDDNFEDDSVDDKITVESQDLQFTDLEVGNIIIVPVKDLQDRIYYHPAEITKLNSEETVEAIHIDYLKVDFDNKKVLRKYNSEKENNWVIQITDITMKLPEPKRQRGRFTFDRELKL